MNSINLDSGISGLAGEYLVVAELIKLGYIATLTSRNAQGIDIIVFNSKATKMVAVQVKTNKGKSPCWVLNKKSEQFYADNLFYVFCNLNNGKGQSFFVVPSKTVAAFTKKFHEEYLNDIGRKGLKHKDTNMRKFVDDKNEYFGRWELLGL